MPPTPRPIAERFWPKVDKTPTCWLWTGSLTRNGYGKIGVGGNRGGWALAHRVAYALAHGPITEGQTVDHICHTRRCVSPRHLQAVPHQANAENRAGATAKSKTGIRGVSVCGKTGRYIVQVSVAGRPHWGGFHDTIAEAEAAAIALRNRVMTNNLADREEPLIA